MTDRSGTDGTSATFDRAARRGAGRERRPDGKEALFSTAPSSAPPPPVEVRCEVCRVTTGIAGPFDWWQVLRPPFLVNPVHPSVWNRCPNCGTRTWLRVTLGGSIRSLLGLPG